MFSFIYARVASSIVFAVAAATVVLRVITEIRIFFPATMLLIVSLLYRDPGLLTLNNA